MSSSAARAHALYLEALSRRMFRRGVDCPSIDPQATVAELERELAGGEPAPSWTPPPLPDIAPPDLSMAFGGPSRRDEAMPVPRAPSHVAEPSVAYAPATPSTSSSNAPSTAPVIAYTDGSGSTGDKDAGAGVVIFDGPVRRELSAFLGKGTNNRAELAAVLIALRQTPAERPLVLRTDSEFALGMATKGWTVRQHHALVAEIRERLQGRDVRFEHVPGHAGIPGNERADQLANEARKGRTTAERTAADGALSPDIPTTVKARPGVVGTSAQPSLFERRSA